MAISLCLQCYLTWQKGSATDVIEKSELVARFSWCILCNVNKLSKGMWEEVESEVMWCEECDWSDVLVRLGKNTASTDCKQQWTHPFPGPTEAISPADNWILGPNIYFGIWTSRIVNTINLHCVQPLSL